MVKASEGLIRVLVDGAKDNALFGKYAVNSIPRVIFLDPDGQQIGQMTRRDPESVKQQFEEILAKHARGPKWMESIDKALEEGKDEKKIVFLFFEDGKPKSEGLKRLFGDASLKELWDQVAAVRHTFDKKDEVCKKWKVTDAGVILLVDATGEQPQVLKTFKTVKTAKDLKRDLEAALKKFKKE